MIKSFGNEEYAKEMKETTRMTEYELIFNFLIFTSREAIILRSPMQTTSSSKHNGPICDAAHIGIPRPPANTLLSFVVCKLTANNREYDIVAQRRLATPRASCTLSAEFLSALTQCKFIL